MRWACAGVWLLAAGPVTSLALDANRSITQYGHERWNHQNGLPGGAIAGIHQLPDGYLLLRAADGLIRFDGVRFVRIEPQGESAAQAGESVRSSVQTRDGQLLIRTPTRVLRGVTPHFRDVLPAGSIPDGLERVIFETRDGVIWVGTDNHLYRYRAGGWENVATGVGWVNHLTEDASGALWIATGTGLYRFAEERLLLYSNGFNTAALRPSLPLRILPPGETDNALLRNSVNVALADRRGTLWVGTRNRLYKVVDGRLIRDAECKHIDGVNITSLLEDRDGNIWMGTDGDGLYRLTHGKWTRLTVATGLSDLSVLALHEDAEGSLWIGTRSGLDRLRDTAFVTLTVEDGLASNAVYALRQASDGALWVTSSSSGIARITESSTRTFTTADGLGGNAGSSPFESRDGSLWFGTSSGLSRFKDGRFTTVGAGTSLDQIYISAIAEDERSLIVATSDLKLVRVTPGGTEPYPLRVPESAGVRYTYVIYGDAAGDLWFGLSAGLYRVPRGTRPEDAIACAVRRPVHVIHDDGQGYLWLASPRIPGFIRYRKADGTTVTFGRENGVQAEGIAAILTDQAGNLWVSTRRGILRYERASLEGVARGEAPRPVVRRFTTADGMRSEEATGTLQQPAAWRTHDGRLLFATQKGVVVVNPSHLPVNNRVPPVVIEEASVGTLPIPTHGQPRLEPGAGRIEINYTALSLLVPERVRFRYRLEGFDDGWVEAGSRRTTFYTSLPPGNYRFHVTGSNNDGIWNQEGASFSFSVLPRFYQTWWFYAACAAGLVLAGTGAVQFRTRRLRRREKELMHVVDERTRSLQEEVRVRSLAETELRTYRQYLEQLVAERTAELSAANHRLQEEIAEREAGKKALQLSQERYKRFFEEDVAGAFIADPKAVLLTCNPAFARIVGYTDAASARGVDLARFFEDSASAAAVFERVRQERTIRGCELEWRRPDGRRLRVLAHIFGSFDAAGELTEMTGYVIDVTERFRLEAQLRQSQKMEAIGQLAGGVAHDFNNLLTAILAWAEMVRTDEAATPEIQRSAGEIREAGERAAALTRQLLAFSRKQMIQPRILDINTVVSEMERMLRRLIGEDIQLQLLLAPAVKAIRGDPGQVEQVILNLALNSRDAMPRGGRLTIETGDVRLDRTSAAEHIDLRAGDYVFLQVTDTGEGMSHEVQSHLFEPFFTTKGVGKGTGLGLSTVYGIVKQSGGHITFSSTEGQGTRFTVYLPAVEPDGAEPRAAAVASFIPRGSETILLVEDNELVLRVAQRILVEQGFRVLETVSALEALQLLEQEGEGIELLLTDVVMPEMSGPELAKRAMSRHPHLRVLYMSGYTDDALSRAGGPAGSGPVLEKPFTQSSLVQRVREVLDAAPGGSAV